MKRITLIGIVLLGPGVLTLVYQGINYTHQEKIFDRGPIHVTAERMDSASSGSWGIGFGWRNCLAGFGIDKKSLDDLYLVEQGTFAG